MTKSCASTIRHSIKTRQSNWSEFQTHHHLHAQLFTGARAPSSAECHILHFRQIGGIEARFDSYGRRDEALGVECVGVVEERWIVEDGPGVMDHDAAFGDAVALVL